MFHSTKRKQIILVRHAKALELSEFSGTDFERPLSDKGQSSSKIVAKYLRLIGVRPDKIIASPAVRTKQTAESIASQYGIDKIDFLESLYNGNQNPSRDANLIHLVVVKNTKKSADILMIVGHNDDLTNFARYLSADGVPSMKKWAIAVLAVPGWVDWKNIVPGTLSLVYYLTPQFLRMEELV